ncbi:MAG: nucleotidyltransferase domain-containing protein [Minisyncoccales bacterium]
MVKFYTYLELFLYDLNKQINLGEFEKYFKKPHQTIKAHLTKFVKLNVLKEEKKEKLRIYNLNLENPLTKEFIIIAEKERLINFLEQKMLFKTLYEELSPYFNESKILLFGSSVNQENFKDIDLLVISKNQELKKSIKKFEQTYSKKIHLIQTRKQDLTKTFIKEIRKKHIILNNHEFFFEVLYE